MTKSTNQMDGKSLTPEQEKLDALKKVLPEVFAEGKVDWKKEELIAYDNASIAEQDVRGKMKFVVDKRNTEIVVKCHNKGMKINDISEITELPSDEVEAIVKEYERKKKAGRK